MLSVSWTQERRGDVTLVGVVLTATGPTPRRGSIAVRLDGPVWPPRRRGVPEAGWQDGRFETVVPANEQIAVGFASPAPPVEPPVELVADERAAADAVEMESADATTEQPSLTAASSPDGIVRALAAPKPPRDAVPGHAFTADPDSAGDRDSAADVDPRGDRDPAADSDPTDDRDPVVENEPAADAKCSRHDGGESDENASSISPRGGVSVPVGGDSPPATIADWLRTVEDRAERAGVLASSPRLPQAAHIVEDLGGIDGVADVQASLTADAEALRSLATRANHLADRCEETAESVPIDLLRRLA